MNKKIYLGLVVSSSILLAVAFFNKDDNKKDNIVDIKNSEFVWTPTPIEENKTINLTDTTKEKDDMLISLSQTDYNNLRAFTHSLIEDKNKNVSDEFFKDKSSDYVLSLDDLFKLRSNLYSKKKLNAIHQKTFCKDDFRKIETIPPKEEEVYKPLVNAECDKHLDILRKYNNKIKNETLTAKEGANILVNLELHRMCIGK